MATLHVGVCGCVAVVSTFREDLKRSVNILFLSPWRHAVGGIKVKHRKIRPRSLCDIHTLRADNQALLSYRTSELRGDVFKERRQSWLIGIAKDSSFSQRNDSCCELFLFFLITVSSLETDEALPFPLSSSPFRLPLPVSVLGSSLPDVAETDSINSSGKNTAF